VRRVTLLPTLTLATACSLVVGTGGLSTGGSGVPGDEAGASSDAPISDARIEEGGLDGGDATTVSPCALPGHLFCDDFDTGQASLSNRWTSLTEEAGPLDLDPSRSISPPRSLRARLLPGSGTRESALRRKVSVPANSVRVELDFYAGTASGTTYAEVDPFGVDLYPPPPGYVAHGLTIAIFPTKATFEYYRKDAEQYDTVDVPISLPRDEFIHMTIVASYVTSPKASLEIDGKLVAELPLNGTTLADAEVAVGLFYCEDANVDWVFAYDNVLVK
jgi:hypothetical protein